MLVELVVVGGIVWIVLSRHVEVFDAVFQVELENMPGEIFREEVV